MSEILTRPRPQIDDPEALERVLGLAGREGGGAS
jgi:hypothetical protein